MSASDLESVIKKGLFPDNFDSNKRGLVSVQLRKSTSDDLVPIPLPGLAKETKYTVCGDGEYRSELSVILQNNSETAKKHTQNQKDGNENCSL